MSSMPEASDNSVSVAKWLCVGMPKLVFMRLIGGPGTGALSRGQRVSNRRFKAESGWAPSAPDARASLQQLTRYDAANR